MNMASLVAGWVRYGCPSGTKKGGNHAITTFLVPESGLFSKEFLADLDRIWALRYYIPDPNRPDYSENI